VEKTFQEKNYSLQTNVCHIRVTVDLPTFCLIKQSNTHTHTIFSVESKELELGTGTGTTQKKIAIQYGNLGDIEGKSNLIKLKVCDKDFR